jgi:hypothetical protein
MTRILSGSLKHLSPPALLRLVSATGASGTLELVTDAGVIQIDIVDGGVRMATERDLTVVARILECEDGSYRFSPLLGNAGETDVILDAADFLAAVQTVSKAQKTAFASDVDVDALIAGDVLELSGGTGKPAIHVLSAAPIENPLDDLLEDLAETAPDELLLAQVGVVSQDPRPWRGNVDREWRRRGWQVRLFGVPHGVDPRELDILVVHQQLSITRIGRQEDWLELVEQTRSEGKPVIWVGPVGDPVWVGQLVDAGVSFLLPSLQIEGGEAGHRFVKTLGTLVERWLSHQRAGGSEVEIPKAVTELVDTLLHGVEAEEALGSFLQLASTQLSRGAVFSVEGTSIRCRAGFGYPLGSGGAVLPRGVGLLERMIRNGEGIFGLDPTSGGTGQLAKAVGLADLPSDAVVLPLGTRAQVQGFLLGDREGDPLPDLSDLSMLARRLGGAFF